MKSSKESGISSCWMAIGVQADNKTRNTCGGLSYVGRWKDKAPNLFYISL